MTKDQIQRLKEVVQSSFDMEADAIELQTKYDSMKDAEILAVADAILPLIREITKNSNLLRSILKID